MISNQYLLACHREDNPCNQLISHEDPPRNIRKNVRTYVHDIARLAPDNHISHLQYKQGLKVIHSNAVETTPNEYQPNLILGGYPPPVAEEEMELPRKTRTILSQLRSGWSGY